MIFTALFSPCKVSCSFYSARLTNNNVDANKRSPMTPIGVRCNALLLPAALMLSLTGSVVSTVVQKLCQCCSGLDNVGKQDFLFYLLLPHWLLETHYAYIVL